MKNCSLHIRTAIVAGPKGKNAVIGDNCLLFVGSTVVKGITIANNVTVGAGSIVNKDVLTCGSTVAGVPARIL